MHSEVINVVAVVLVAGVIAQWLGWRLRVPAIVFLLAGGLVAGPFTGALDPDEVFGDLLFPGVSIAVAVILFEGALGLGWRRVRTGGSTVWMLLTVGAAITAVGTAVTARYVLDIGWDLAVLLAAVLVVTGPTVVGPIVRAIGLHGRLGSLLEAEGTLIDPIGAILAVLVFEAAFAAEGGATSVIGGMAATFGSGAVVGVIAAGIVIVTFSRYLIPDELHNVTILATVIGAFAAANALREEAGLVAVTVMGLVLASQHRVPVRQILQFNETLRTVFISALFLLLGARIQADTLREFEWRNVVFLAVLVLLVRPISVAVSTIRSGFSLRERLFLAAVAPRGIVAAAVASVFSLRLADIGVADSQILVSATFTIIAGTVLFSGVVSRPMAIRMGLAAPERSAIIVLGANPVARAVAAALERHQAPVRMVDLDRRELATARMDGLLVRRGSVFSEQTWESAGLFEAACFLALTRNDELNTVASRQVAEALGRRCVFQLAPTRPEHRSWWTLPAGTFARPLFGRDVDYAAVAARLEQGDKISSTRLTDKFGVREYRTTHPTALPLFIVDRKGRITLVAGDSRRRPRVGDTIVALTTPPPEQAEANARNAAAATERSG